MNPLPDQQYIEGYQAGVEYCCVFRPSLTVAASQKEHPPSDLNYNAAKGWCDAMKDYLTMHERIE